MLREYRESFVPESQKANEEMLLSDYMLRWLEIAKSTIAVTTFSSYSQITKSIIVPYFKERKITLKNLSASDIQDFYTDQLRRVGANSVIHYHAVIHRALKYAVRTDLIPVNPADKIRFHDLRHSCASLLLSNGVPMKQIQEWLGHSDFSTTANIYAHLDFNSKLSSAEAMIAGLGL